ncbi:MAG: flagellar biosynthesis anti-sigma factor FlgM [Pseudomonadota bacterium]
MISKIKDTATPLIQHPKNKLTKNEAGKLIGASSALTEKVNLSTRARDIQQIRQILDQTPDIREDKILELKHQIDGGNYGINAETIAEKLVEECVIDLFA